MIIRKAAPDFAVAAWGLHMELRNGDRNALSKPLALRGGITVALEVVAVPEMVLMVILISSWKVFRKA